MSLLCQGDKMTKDKGYVWVILLMSFLSHFVHLGFSSGIAGNLTIVHQEFYNIDLQQGSLIGTVHGGLIFLFGPVASILVKKFGCRMTQLIGGSWILLGVGLCALCKESWHALLLYGLLAGAGASCCYTASSQILGVHFEKFKYLAFSLAVAGQYTGMITWPILSQHLLDKYGYSKAMGIMASAHVIHLIAGISFFEPQDVMSVSEVDQSKDGEKPQTADLQSNENVEKLGEEKYNSTSSVADEIGKGSPDLKKDFLELLKPPQIWVLMANGLLWNTNSTGFLILVNDYIVHNTSMEADEAAYGITIVGIAQMIGCLVVILTSSLSFDRIIMHNAAIGFFGIAAIAVTFTTSKAMYYGLAACWGLGQSITTATLLSVVSDFCNVRQLPLMFGLHLLADGIGSLGFVSLAAKIAEVTAEQYGLIFVGSAAILGAIIMAPVVVIRQKKGVYPDMSSTDQLTR